MSGVNKILKTFCNQNGWGYVDHSNISPEHDLNRSGLPLNTKGTARLATNVITCYYVTCYYVNAIVIADWETDESLLPRINRKNTNNKGDPSSINLFGRGFVMAALNINSLDIVLTLLWFADLMNVTEEVTIHRSNVSTLLSSAFIRGDLYDH